MKLNTHEYFRFCFSLLIFDIDVLPSGKKTTPLPALLLARFIIRIFETTLRLKSERGEIKSANQILTLG